jgi:hypothetical protein
LELADEGITEGRTQVAVGADDEILGFITTRPLGVAPSSSRNPTLSVCRHSLMTWRLRRLLNHVARPQRHGEAGICAAEQKRAGPATGLPPPFQSSSVRYSDYLDRDRCK